MRKDQENKPCTQQVVLKIGENESLILDVSAFADVLGYHQEFGVNEPIQEIMHQMVLKNLADSESPDDESMKPLDFKKYYMVLNMLQKAFANCEVKSITNTP